MKKALATFLKNFIVKYLSIEIIEEIVIDLLRAMAKKTKTELDDKIIEKLFGKEKENE